MSAQRRGAKVTGAVELDPLYAQTLSSMQQGRWQEAGDALAALQARYPRAAALEPLSELLALRLSAEESWAEANRSRLPAPLQVAARLAVPKLQAAAELSARSLQAAGRLVAPFLAVPAVRMLVIANLFVYLALGAAWLLGG